MEEKQTIPLTAQNKTDWNNFQTHLNGDYPTTGALNKFNAENPKSSLTEDHIPAALNYIQSIKTNPDIQGLTPAYKNGNNMRFPVYADGSHLQVPDAIQQGPGPKYATPLPPADEQKYQQWKKQLPGGLGNDSDYDLRGLYKENPNIQPSANLHFSDKYKQPNHITFSDESIYNGKDGQKGGHWGRQGNQDTFEATDQNIKNAGGIQQLQDYFKKKEPNVKLILPNSGTSSQIPAPDYNNPSSRLQYAQQFAKKYGPSVHGRGDTPLRVNDIPRAASDTVKNISTQIASKYGIDPSVLYSSSMEEGMSGLFKNPNGTDTKGRKPGDFGYQDNFGDKDFPVNGEWSFGLNSFSDRFPDLVKGGYLPKDFVNRFRGAANEGTFNKNNFKTTDDAMTAAAAVIKYHYDDIDKFASKNGITLTPKARDFFALTAYNGGEGTAHQMIKDYNKNGLLANDNFIDKRPTSGTGLKETSYKDVHEHVAKRIKMAQALKSEGLF